MKKYFLLITSIMTTLVASPAAAPVGLANQGNTCYLNAVVQCLYNIDYITNVLLSSYQDDPYTSGSLAAAYLALIPKPDEPIRTYTKEEMDTIELALADAYLKLIYKLNALPAQNTPGYAEARKKIWNNELTSLVTAAQLTMGGSWQQEDAPEFIRKLINSLIEKDKRYSPSTLSPLQEILKIEGIDIIQCPVDVNFKNITPIIDLYLNIPASKHGGPNNKLMPLTSLENCLNQYYTTETDFEFTLPGYLQQQNNCTKKIETIKFSNIVVIMPNRFTFDKTTKQQRKLDHNITTPLTIDFKKYISPSEQHKSLYRYDLIATAQHAGTTTASGHYIAHVKNETTGQWYECNDSRITQESIATAQTGINQSYVFVYKKNEPNLIKELQSLTKNLNALHTKLVS